jgi:hypothetical protein
MIAGASDLMNAVLLQVTSVFLVAPRPKRLRAMYRSKSISVTVEVY